MTTIFARIFIIYFTVIFSVRLMGKRQIGELQLSELVTTIFISELAASPVTDNGVPILYGIIPILLLLATEVILSFLSSKFKPFQKAFDNKPGILIKKGSLDLSEMKKARMTPEELLSQLRLKGFYSLSKIEYAILEPNGQISVLPKPEEAPVTVKDMSLSGDNDGMCHPVITGGKENQIALKAIGKNKRWLEKKLAENKAGSMDNVFLMTVDDNDNVVIIKQQQ